MQGFRRAYEQYKKIIDRRLRILAAEGDQMPRSLADPVRYALSGGGKRIRPVLLILAYQAVQHKPGKFSMGRVKDVLDAAVAIEALHNFTLVHDDIMDNAPMRRGRATVHSKWDEDTAILVGDELVALAYRSLLKIRSTRMQEILEVFTNGVLDVCEGQGFDKDFQFRTDVSLGEYLRMIEKKTARMVSTALEIGALAGGGSESEVGSLRRYGQHIGRAFQIQDDLLDTIGSEKFGKKIGGDIIEGKKTYLLLKAAQLARNTDKHLLGRMMSGGRMRPAEVGKVKSIYEKYGVIDHARRAVYENVRRAKQALQPLKPGEPKEMLLWLAEMLRDRRA
jgi:geranylgeranyl diphosphate synthase type II